MAQGFPRVEPSPRGAPRRFALSRCPTDVSASPIDLEASGHFLCQLRTAPREGRGQEGSGEPQAASLLAVLILLPGQMMGPPVGKVSGSWLSLAGP